jgi:hypothetical protein
VGSRWTELSANANGTAPAMSLVFSCAAASKTAEQENVDETWYRMVYRKKLDEALQ